MTEYEEQKNIHKIYREFIESVRQPKWVNEMINYYYRTGAWRISDMRRLLGDPNGCVQVGPGDPLESFVRRLSGIK